VAKKYYYVGSAGPYIFQDGDDVPGAGPGKPFAAGTKQAGIVTDGQIHVETAPTDGEHVVRLADVIDIIYPIGSIYLSVVATNPNTTLGAGTWVAVSVGKYLVGYSNGDPDFDPVENTGGAKLHYHNVDIDNTTSDGPSAIIDVDRNLDGITINVGAADHTHDVDPVLEASGVNNVITPFFVVYVWKRTA